MAKFIVKVILSNTLINLLNLNSLKINNNKAIKLREYLSLLNKMTKTKYYSQMENYWQIRNNNKYKSLFTVILDIYLIANAMFY